MKGLTIWFIFVPNALCELAPVVIDNYAKYNHLLIPLVIHFKTTKFPVVFWLDEETANQSAPHDTLNAILLGHDWMSVIKRNTTRCVRLNRLQNVFITLTYSAMIKLIFKLDYDCFYSAGRYIFIVTDETLNESEVKSVFEAVWKKQILNVALIVSTNGSTTYRAYGYEPHQHGNCGKVRPKLLDQYTNDRWHRLDGWFERFLPNYRGCPLRAVTFESKPFVMLRNSGSQTQFFGLEVLIFESIVAKLNTTVEYVSPPNNTKWGVLLPVNSTGQMGMLQRSEADVGFSSIGRSIDRNIHLQASMPSIVTQLTMTIPPKVPYTSLEKLFLPFSLSAWVLVAVGYSVIYCLYVALFRAKHHPYLEHIRSIFYTIWTILMGGPGYDARRHSTRIYVISLVLNAFVVRNLYQSALFQYLKSNDMMAANLHTYKDINEAGLSYYMYQTTRRYFEDNPEVNSTIRTITDENTEWDDVMYNISHHLLQGVIPLPLESIFYYVKNRKPQDMVYVSEHTGISYFIAFHFPRISALQKPFNYLLYQLQAGGFIKHWKDSYRNDPRSWMNYEQENVPTPLDLHQVSGGFYLWAFCLLVSMVAFTVELLLSKITRATKPYSMVHREGNVTKRFGMEVTIVENIAKWFNFSIAYSSPVGKVKWGIIQATNSTGLVGMIQRNEVDFGFGTVGINVHRNKFLKMGTPNFLSQLNVAIPPDKPYTWWDKLYEPFSPAAWLCLILCYSIFILVTVIIFDSKLVTTVEHFPNPAYNLWELLMGGPAVTYHRSSIRLFITGFVLNALVIRTMYQSAMFQRLQATTRLGTKINTFQQINDAKLLYYMYITTSLYYQDNPLLCGRIRIIQDEDLDMDEIMYNISQHKLNGVFSIPLDAIEYYVKNYGQRGIVYVGKHTGFNYNLGIYYPKDSPLTEPFDMMIGRYQAAGLIHIWRERFRDTRYWNGAKLRPEPISLQWRHVSDDLMRANNARLIVTYQDLPAAEGRPSYYNVLLVQDYNSLRSLLDRMTYQTHHFYGLYTIFIQHLSNLDQLQLVMEMLWSLRIINVVVIVETNDAEFVAYAYHPYRERKCGIVKPYEIDRFVNGAWTDLAHWYPKRTENFNGCPLTIGTIDIRPCSIIYRDGNRTMHKGIEVSQILNLSKRFNFTVRYLISDGETRWGFAREVNSTGLMGMIQRNEVDFGFGSIGIGLARVMYLRAGTPSRYGQVLMAIPPKRPFTSLEKLFQPFSMQTWLCVVFCLMIISLLAHAMFGLRKDMAVDRLPHTVYTMWVLTMGGPSRPLRMDSSRLFIVIFILNMLVLRTLYHAGMFERLQASNSLASDLNTLEQINKAGKVYHMHKTITLYFNDNPLVGPRRIRLIQNDNANWEDILYKMSQHGSDFVVALPLDCIKYYVKMNGERGLVYVGKHTGITYNTAFYYPKTTSLQEPFSTQVLAFHSAGLINYWAQTFEDNRFWSNAMEDPEPASIKWDHISGAFYLCGTMHLLACGVFIVELGYARLPKKPTNSASTPFQDELVKDITRFNTDWMIVSYGDLAASEHRFAYYNVLLVLDYDAFAAGLESITETSHLFYGLYTFFIEQHDDREALGSVMQMLWNVTIINVVVIVEESDGAEYVAYSYHPYRAQACGIVEPYEVGRYANGTWDTMGSFLFSDKLSNLHGCPLTVTKVEIKPFSMVRVEGDHTTHYGLEVYIVDTLASRMNFTIRYVEPRDNSKWGILQATNSTGVVGMLQRKEADFGFGSLGFSLSRHTYLKMGVPNFMTQMIMGIPPKRPYTSLEKLFQPFTVDAWLCIAFGYTVFGFVTLGLVKLNRGTVQDEHLRNPVYMLWVLLMGGSAGRYRLDSTRLFIIGFILNTLIIRTLYQAGMFQRLQSSASLASDLNTLDAINKAGLYYNMFRASQQFYRENPKVPASRIKLIQNDHLEWDDLFSELAHDRLGGVMVSPYECITYYVKMHGKDGVIFVGKNTGFMYNIGFHFPKTTALLAPFDSWIIRMHAAGLIHHWSTTFRDDRYWSNAKEDPEPASLKWNQISGGFYLCSMLLLFSLLVFLGEIMHFRLRTSRLLQRTLQNRYKPKKEA
uniref:Ionotropic glutamate receptor L-glutamate and glycine-binding domain-containing protein n=1 Tax=Anopheles minimus TaxID=112268 RepID=A0A182VZP8_9DIPT